MSDGGALKAKLGEWKRRLSERDMHSITHQVARMLWRSAFYRSINESRRFVPDDDDNGGRKANGPLHELIDDGYLIVHATAIRRLLDEGRKSGPRGVYSLYVLIRDIKDNAKLITRANVLAARGLEYDFEPIKERARQDACAEKRARPESATFVSRAGWQDAEHWHRAMDSLCGVTGENRSADDMPDAARFERLLQELAKHGGNVRDWVNKYVAHAASPDSRQTLPPEHQNISLAKLWLAERVVVRAASFISYYIVDGTNLGGVPVPQFDQFVHLNRPFVEPSAIAPMRQAWDQHSKEVDSCQEWFWDSPLADESDVWKDSE